MRYPYSKTEQLKEELFRNPTAEYRGIPFWSWNCKITKELIDWQLDCFKEMGFGGVDIHPRSGLDTQYLGEEYMQLIAYTVERCREKGLLCWLYDEDRFPSGAAGGMVTKDWHMRGRFLLLTKEHCGDKNRENWRLPGFCENWEAFKKAIEKGEKPLGYYAAAYSLTLENGYLEEYRRLYTKEEIFAALDRKENVRFAYIKLMEEEHWFEDQAYVDTMNPKAIRSFIDVTHEAYYKVIGDEFGKCVPAIFTDEPRLGKHPQISFAMSDEDVTIPYTEYFAGQMQLLHGKDALDLVPEYIWERKDGRKSVDRYLYRDVAAECFVSAFMDQICGWCGEHGIAMTGHVLGEDSLISQTFALGDCMRCYRKMDLPGIDVLTDRRELVAAKQAVSVAKQNGREGTISELYGVTHWDCEFKTYKLQGDWQAALGITVRIPHLSHMSLEGEAKRDWPASIFFQSPWYQEFPYIEDYFARLNTVLTRGKAVTRIAVIHPVESMWLCFGPNDQTDGIQKERNTAFDEMVKWLLYGLLDFDFVSEALLPGQWKAVQEKDGPKKDGLIEIGEMAYSTVVIPGCITLRSTTLDALEDFSQKGGKLIFMGNIPALMDGVESERAGKLAGDSIRIPESRSSLLEVLEPERDVEIRKQDGTLSDNLFYQFREEGACKWLFICHVNRKRNRISSSEEYVIRIKGSYELTRYDPLTGEKKAVIGIREGGSTFLCWSAYAQDSILLKLTERIQEELPYDHKTEQYPYLRSLCEKSSYREVITLKNPCSFNRQEPNVLLLDYAKYQVDDGPVCGKEEILRVDNEIRSRLGFLLRGGRMNQPWAMKEKEVHKVILYYNFLSETDTCVQLAIEKPESCKIYLNGEKADNGVRGYYVDPAISVINLPSLRKGNNKLVVEMKYHQKTELENLYLLGDFEVELRGSKALIKAGETPLAAGDITRQGMPFYTGNLEYRYRFLVEAEGEYYVHVPHFASPVLAVFLDGQKKGVIAFAPHRLCLGNLQIGEHELQICLYGNRFNGFGTLHNANDEFVWYGAESYRTAGDEWSDSYLVRPVGILGEIVIEQKQMDK